VEIAFILRTDWYRNSTKRERDSKSNR